MILNLKQISPFAEDNSSIGSIATSVLANEIEEMEGTTFLSDLLFQRVVVLAKGCYISFDNCKGHEL